jgi:hypothetical protein
MEMDRDPDHILRHLIFRLIPKMDRDEHLIFRLICMLVGSN